MTKYDEAMKLYPEEYKAIQDFLVLYMNICLDYATWTINTILEYPPVQEAIEYIVTLTPEKVQATLDIVIDSVMTTMNKMEEILTSLMVEIPKEIPALIEMHIPSFIITFIKSIVSYLNELTY